MLRSAHLFFKRLLSPAALGVIAPKPIPFRLGKVAADTLNSSESGSACARKCELSLSDVGAVARRIGDAFGVDPGSLRFLRLQASMVFRGDDNWVYRVPAKDHVREGFSAERDLMALLAPRMPVATPVWEVAGDPPLARYRFIPGEAFKADDVPDGAVGERLLADLAAFLAALHATPPPPHVPQTLRGRGMRRWAVRLRERDRSDLAERLERSVGRFVDAMAERPRVLCHGDLKGGNILVDATTRTLVGVIDFTGWTVAPPESELARIGLSDPLRGRLADHYTAVSGLALNREALDAASQFYACRREAKQVLKGSP